MVGKQIDANVPDVITKKAVKIMRGALATNLKKVTRMTHFGEMFYSTDYGKLKTCSYCVEYERRGVFGVVEYYLYCAPIGDAVAVIKPLHQLDNGFQTPPLDNDCLCHIQRVVMDKRLVQTLLSIFLIHS